MEISSESMSKPAVFHRALEGTEGEMKEEEGGRRGRDLSSKIPVFHRGYINSSSLGTSIYPS